MCTFITFMYISSINRTFNIQLQLVCTRRRTRHHKLSRQLHRPPQFQCQHLNFVIRPTEMNATTNFKKTPFLWICDLDNAPEFFSHAKFTNKDRANSGITLYTCNVSTWSKNTKAISKTSGQKTNIV